MPLKKERPATGGRSFFMLILQLLFYITIEPD